MDAMQRRALLIVIEGVEHQLKSVKSLLMTTMPSEPRPAPNLEKREQDGYTTKEQDDIIAAELEILEEERERVAFLEDLVNKTKASPNGQ